MLAVLGMVASGKSGYSILSRRKFLWKHLSLGRGNMPVPQHSRIAQEGPKHFVGDWSSKALARLLMHQLEDLVLKCWGGEHMHMATWAALPLPLFCPMESISMCDSSASSNRECPGWSVSRMDTGFHQHYHHFMPGLCSAQLTFAPGWGCSPPLESI